MAFSRVGPNPCRDALVLSFLLPSAGRVDCILGQDLPEVGCAAHSAAARPRVTYRIGVLSLALSPENRDPSQTQPEKQQTARLGDRIGG